MFFRQQTDGMRTDVMLENLYAGPERTACWIVGGGPSLASLDPLRLAASPIPKFAMNLAGAGLLRPNLWTSYDPTARFLTSVYRDPSILKLLQARRAMDLVPGTTHKVCDCPNTVFFERESQLGFHEFPVRMPGTGLPSRDDRRIVDWQDSLVQALHLAYVLGFRQLYLVGCEMHVRPSAAAIELARSRGVAYEPLELLRDFHDRCRMAGLNDAELSGDAGPRLYHFDETKSLRAAENTDFHYFRVAQYLRLSRRAMALAGLEVISATPDSRLNDFFAYRSYQRILAEIRKAIGDPARESTRGRYTSMDSPPAASRGPMRDFKPHNWKPQRTARPEVAAPAEQDELLHLRREIDQLQEEAIDLD